MILECIVSGGQTGVDRAALEVAIDRSVPCGGWCPSGRLAEDGAIPEEFPLQETGSSSYAERTERNILDSDATLIINRGRLSGGTALTAQLAQQNQRPLLVVSPDSDAFPTARWLQLHAVRVLNVAGPRHSKDPGIHALATEFLGRVLDLLGQPKTAPKADEATE